MKMFTIEFLESFLEFKLFRFQNVCKLFRAQFFEGRLTESSIIVDFGFIFFNFSLKISFAYFCFSRLTSSNVKFLPN